MSDQPFQGQVSPQDALNVANASYVNVMQKTSDAMDELRVQQVFSVKAAIEAAFAIASATLLYSMFEAAMQAGMAAGSYSAGRGVSQEEKAIKGEATRLENDIKGIDEELKKPGLGKERREELLAKKDDLKSRLGKLHDRVRHKVSLAQTKAGMYQAASQGLGSVPKGMQESLQEQGRAVKSVTDQTTQLFNTTYDKQSQVLKGFLDIDFLAGLVSLGNIQLK